MCAIVCANNRVQMKSSASCCSGVHQSANLGVGSIVDELCPSIWIIVLASATLITRLLIPQLSFAEVICCAGLRQRSNHWRRWCDVFGELFGSMGDI